MENILIHLGKYFGTVSYQPYLFYNDCDFAHHILITSWAFQWWKDMRLQVGHDLPRGGYSRATPSNQRPIVRLFQLF